MSDPFARYIEPAIEQAVFEVLSTCGYDVQVLPVLGAGASLLSKGFVEAAKRHAGKVLDALNQLDPTREAVAVGIEPPEIYCLKNDYVDLLPNRRDEIASRVARTWLLDEYLLRSERFLNLRVDTILQQNDLESKSSINNNEIASSGYHPPGNDKMKVKFQPHCHQRAEGLAGDGLPSGTNATTELLRMCGYDVEVLDTGCCGMAGTFGYEAEHYELSQQVGKLKLFPKIREQRIVSEEEAVVVSTGAVCRMQIQQGTGTGAVHPVLLVRKALL